MSDYKQGDFMEARKGRTTIRGPVNYAQYGGGLAIDDSGWSLGGLNREHWILEIVEEPVSPVVLPIVPGLYTAGDRLCFGTDIPLLYWLDKELQWSVLWTSVPAEKRTTEQMIFGTHGTLLVRVDVVDK